MNTLQILGLIVLVVMLVVIAWKNSWLRSEWKYLWLTASIGLASLVGIPLVSLLIIDKLAAIVSVPLPEGTWLGVGIIGWIFFVGYFLVDRIHYVPLRKIHVVQTANGDKRFLRGGLRGLRPGNDEVQMDPNNPSKIWEIDLEKANIPIGRTKDGSGDSKVRIFMTNDSPRQPVAVRYRGVICPDDSSDNSLARRILYGPDVIAEQFEALIDQNLSDRIAKLKQKEILGDKARFVSEIEAIFKKAAGAVHAGHETRFGSTLDSFAVEQVELDPDIIKALKAGTEMKIFNTRVKQLVKDTKIEPGEALDGLLVLAGRKTAASQTIAYEGLENLKELRVFAPGGGGKVGVLAGDGKSGKKGGNKP